MKTTYQDTVERLVAKMKIAIDQCLKIIEQELPDEMAEDKMHNVLRGKRQATEDAIYYAKEIDKFEKELRGEDEVTKADSEKKKTPKGAERFSKE